MQKSFFNDKVIQFHLPGFEDSRGLLLPVDFETIEFAPIRTFLVVGRDGKTRGGHAHRYGKQVLLRISGEIQVDLSLHGTQKTIVLGPDSNAVMIAAPVWSSQTYRGREPSLAVFCDHLFDPSSYILDPE